MTFRLPLHVRLRVSRRRKERYATDPAYRLAQINVARVRCGKQPYASLDDVGHALSRYASQRKRGDDGRFV